MERLKARGLCVPKGMTKTYYISVDLGRYFSFEDFEINGSVISIPKLYVWFEILEVAKDVNFGFNK